MPTAWLISIGTELTLGQTVDTNSAWIAEQLAAHGVRCAAHMTVPDEIEYVAAAIRRAAEASDLVVISGGLGPTEDDLTRAALARATDDSLTIDTSSLEHIRAFFEKRGRVMPEANRTQALVPSRARAIANPCGTAPGITLHLGQTPCYALPGVPFEMKAMFTDAVLPALRAASGGRVVRTRLVHCCGIGEAELGERIHDLMQRGGSPEVGTTAALGIISVRINATTASVDKADRMLDKTEALVRERLGVAVFGRDRDSLASVVGEQLRARDATLSTAESCTGGLIGAQLTDVPGSSDYFLGGVISYANEVKRDLLDVDESILLEHGAVCDGVAHAMARGVRRRFSSTYALSVTGIAGPGGGSDAKPVGLVYIGLASPQRIHVIERRFGSAAPRSVIRTGAAIAALNLLRLELVK